MMMPRFLRTAFGPMVRDLWIYLAAPGVFVVSEIIDHPDWPISAYASRFALAFVVVVCLGLPAHAMYAHLGKYVFPDRFRWWELAAHALFVGTSVFVGTEIAMRFLMAFALEEVTSERAWHLRHIAWLGGTIAIGGYAGASFGINRSKERLAATELRASEARRAALNAQLQALQARIQPHFLFNCLNTVAGLIEEDPKRANEAVERLSDLFRYTLDSSGHTTVPLAEEIRVLRDFLELESLRYGDRLAAAIEISPESVDAHVPPLILQAVVENAVLHGIAGRRNGGRLEIAARVEANRLLLSVEDDGPGPGQSRHEGAGSALADLRSRLQLLYGDGAQVLEGPGPLGGYRIEIRIPHHRHASTHGRST